MKSFKQYLIETKQTYDFKIKIAGDCPEDCESKIKESLSKYEVASCSQGKRTPIQETHTDFPEHKNVNITIYDVCTNYPATGAEIRASIAEALGMSDSCIKVRNVREQAEEVLNHEHDEKTGKSLLGADYEKSNNQDLVGDKGIAKFLKELTKQKTPGEQYTGINEKLLAKKLPKEKAPVAVKAGPAKSVLGASKGK